MKNGVIKNLTLTAMFLAIGLELPFLTGQIQQIGNMLLPMHIPVFLCALICGWKYGLPMAFILPLLRSFMFGRPALYPNAIGMAFELAAYAFVAGFLYEKFRWPCTKALYRCMLIAMAAGRIVWGAVQTVLLGFGGSAFNFSSVCRWCAAECNSWHHLAACVGPGGDGGIGPRKASSIPACSKATGRIGGKLTTKVMEKKSWEISVLA